jgi:OOP family OmpA-OmpF porin
MPRIAKLSTIAAVALFGTYMAFGCKATVTTGEATPPPTPSASTTTPPPPPPDKDGDGIADADDACPDKPGKANEDKTKNGCPEVAPLAAIAKKVEIVGNEVKISEKIMFDTGKATIKAESEGLLNEIADVIKNQGKDINLIEVGGHTDKVGNEKDNLKLSDDRAKAVLDAMVKRGVDAKKLRAKGYGPYCVSDPGTTPEANEKNRRVQFVILKSGGKVTTAPIGCEEAVKKGVKPQPIL